MHTLALAMLHFALSAILLIIGILSFNMAPIYCWIVLNFPVYLALRYLPFKLPSELWAILLVMLLMAANSCLFGFITSRLFFRFDASNRS